MRALFSLASLVIVLCVITVAVQHQLRSMSAPGTGGGAPSASGANVGGPGGANPSSVAQYKATLDATLQDGAAGRAAAADAAEAQQPQR